jgi:hypothetical protein
MAVDYCINLCAFLNARSDQTSFDALGASAGAHLGLPSKLRIGERGVNGNLRCGVSIALLFCSAPTLASDWVRYGVEKGNDTFVDMESIQRQGNFGYLWTKVAFRPQTHPDPTKRGRWINEMMARWAFDCVKATVQLATIIAYFDDGTNATDVPGSVDPIVPDSNSDHLMKLACGKS